MRLRLSTCAALLAALATAGCGGPPHKDHQAHKVDVRPPERGACRALTPADIGHSSNDSPAISCRRSHTAETFLVGTFRGKLAGLHVDDPALGAAVFRSCGKEFRRFTGADESLALRSVLSWAWFRPTKDAWDGGARWYRCDVVGGDEDSSRLVSLPPTTHGVLLGLPGDRWIACVDAPEVVGSRHVPCTEKHTWRAVTTIVVGQPKDAYPGDRLVEVLTRDYCSDSVGAWMNYPIDYEYAYTWFHEAEWKAGNRRSVCWAKTDQ